MPIIVVMERIGHRFCPEVAEDSQPLQLAHGNPENQTAPHRKGKKKTRIPRVPPKVPKEWIQKAVRFLKDSCFCNATAYGLWRFLSPEQLTQIIPKGTMKKSFQQAINEVRAAGWGTSQELTDPNKNKEEPGVLAPCRNQSDGDCIKLNQNLHPARGAFGDYKQIKGSDLPLRHLVLPHEALHKLFRLWGPDIVKNIGPVAEEKIIQVILDVYFGRPDKLPDKISELPLVERELFEAISACRVLGSCDRVRPAMAPPVGPAPKTVELQPDYNNDGRIDAAGPGNECDVAVNAEGGKSWYMNVYDHIPRLCLDRAGECFYDQMSLYREECPLPKPYQVGEIWKLDRFVYQAWLKPPSFASSMRFFNNDQTMHFVPGQAARMRGSDVQGSIERLIVRIDLTTGVQAGPVYAELPQCAMIPVDDLVWVDAEGVALDMRALMAAARMPTPNDAEDKSMQGRMRVLLQSALSVAADPVKSPPEKCDAILAYAQAFSGREKLPDGWEESVLLALDLPREVPPPKAPCTGPSCGPPPGGSPDQPPRTKTRTTMVR